MTPRVVPPAALVASAERAIGRSLQHWVDASDRGGLSSSARFTAVTSSGTRVFVKASGPDAGHFGTATEIRTYASLGVKPWLPTMLGHDDGDPTTGPVLVLEDLTGCTWPPPWSPAMIHGTTAAIESIATTPVPAWVPPISQLDPEFVDRWPSIQGRGTDVAATGVCSFEWATDHIETLVAEAARFERSGTALCHLDLWSDNVCQRSDGEILITDWTDICRANPAFMMGIWASDTCADAAIPIEELMPDDRGLAPYLIGLGLSRLVDPPPWMGADAERLVRRRVDVLLPHVARSLDLPDPMTDVQRR